jgi:acyl-CoA dehydrogenase
MSRLDGRGSTVDFSENDDHLAIREAIREICPRFPDEYWADLDATHTFPREFYEAMAKGGWIGVAIPAELGGAGAGITEASILLEEVAASGACMNGASAIHQTHGGFCYATEYHVERYWREARLTRIAPVPQEMVLNYLAEHVLGLPRSY